MKGEVRREDGRWGTDTMAKREIGENTYVVLVQPLNDERNASHVVSVLADTVNGEDLGFPNGLRKYEIRDSGYETLVSGTVAENEKLAAMISKGVNKAVGILTDKLEETKSNEDAVLGALEANAEVHDDNS
jgi:hypothetical protein